jgi:hypothetical protein
MTRQPRRVVIVGVRLMALSQCLAAGRRYEGNYAFGIRR